MSPQVRPPVSGSPRPSPTVIGSGRPPSGLSPPTSSQQQAAVEPLEQAGGTAAEFEIEVLDASTQPSRAVEVEGNDVYEGRRRSERAANSVEVE